MKLYKINIHIKNVSGIISVMNIIDYQECDIDIVNESYVSFLTYGGLVIIADEYIDSDVWEKIETHVIDIEHNSEEKYYTRVKNLLLSHIRNDLIDDIID